MNQHLSKDRTVRLFEKAKYPANLFATKFRNFVRRILPVQKQILNCNHNLKESSFSYIQKRSYLWDIYCLSGCVYSPTSIQKNIKIAFQFYDSHKCEIKESGINTDLRYEKNVGYVKEIICEEVFSVFSVFYRTPKKTRDTKITVISKTEKSKNIYLLSGTHIRRMRGSYLDVPLVLNRAYSQFYGNFDVKAPEVQDFCQKYLTGLAFEKHFLLRLLFKEVQKFAPYAGKYFGQVIFEEFDSSLNTGKVLYYAYRRSGNISERHKLVQQLGKKNPLFDDFIKTKTEEDDFLLKNNFSFSNPKTRSYTVSKNTFYLLHNSLPYNSGGYATRSHGLIKGIDKNSDYKIRGFTRSGYPTDRKNVISKKIPPSIPDKLSIDEIEYFYGSQEIDKERCTIREHVRFFADELVSRVRSLEPGVIHAASFFHNGLAAIEASKRLGIKSAYEVRGLQEITKLSKEPYWEHTDQYAYFAKLEAQALQDADAAFTITNALRDLMISRGVTKKINVIPNAVDTDKFVPSDKDAQLASSLGIHHNETVIGYVGSIVEYEGLDDLLVACKGLKKQNKNFKLLIVGDGAHIKTIKNLTYELSLSKSVIFTGRVPHSEVNKYISLIDIMPFPRKPYLVCEMVSPLKPFESLACKKAVIVSSCAALKEIIKDGETGLVFEKANTVELTEKLKILIANKELREKVAENGHQWVRQNRTWKAVSKIVTDVYDELYDQMRFEGK